MELFYVYTCNGRIFYTSLSLNDRFKQYQTFNSVRFGPNYHGYQVFNPARYRQDYRSCYSNRTPKRSRNVIFEGQNRFEKAPVIWDSKFYEHSNLWTFFRESPYWSSSCDRHEPEIYRPVANARNKNKKRTKKPARRALTKEELDDELDQYMINIQ